MRRTVRNEALSKGMVTYSNSFAWRIPRTEEPGRLHSPWGRKESDTTERLHFPFPMAKTAGSEDAELTSFHGHTKITTIYGALIFEKNMKSSRKEFSQQRHKEGITT